MKSTTMKKLTTTLYALLLIAISATSQAAVESTTYILTDHLGSPILATDENGDTLWREDYQPYGTQLTNEDGDNSVGFTGHKDDKALGVTYMQGRWYHQDMGRFLAIDPVGFVEGNPITFNRYAYANNNPYKYVDPDGRTPENLLIWDYPAYQELRGAQLGIDPSTKAGALSIAKIDQQEAVMELVGIGVGAGVGRLASGFSRVAKSAAKLCFVEGTLVHTQNGLKPIEEIQVGDLVESKDEFTGETTWKPVSELFRNYDKSILNVTLVNAAGKEELLGVTAEHPFWVEGLGWVDAGELHEGQIISSVDGDVLTVNSIVPDEQLHDTYNFEVADYHTYFVGEQGAWVHNTCLPTVKKAVNSNLPHARDQAVVREVFPDAKSATDGLKALSESISKNGFPKGTILDTARADRVLVPVGNNGLAAFQVGSNGTAKLKTVLIAR